MTATVEFYKDESDKHEWRWRVKAANGQIVGASTEGYGHESHARNNLTSLPRYCRDVDVRTAAEQSDPRPDGATLPLEFYKDKAGEWRWRVTARNGQVVHASSEGYKDKAGARGNLESLVAAVAAWEG